MSGANRFVTWAWEAGGGKERERKEQNRSERRFRAGDWKALAAGLGLRRGSLSRTQVNRVKKRMFCAGSQYQSVGKEPIERGIK